MKKICMIALPLKVTKKIKNRYKFMKMFRIKKKRFPQKIKILNFTKKSFYEKKFVKGKNFLAISYDNLIKRNTSP